MCDKTSSSSFDSEMTNQGDTFKKTEGGFVTGTQFHKARQDKGDLVETPLCERVYLNVLETVPA